MTESNAETIGLLDPMVADAVSRLARTPRLLVASDYDGTLAPIVDDPAAAVPIRDAIVALRLLAELPGTNVAVISGRSLADLSRLTGFDGGGGAVHLVGSHGSEFDRGMATALTSEEQALRERVLNSVSAIAADHPGTHVERKPASIALHYRRAEPAVGEAAAAAMLDGPAKLDGVQIKEGKMVVELSVVATDKGSALETIRRRVGADAAIFVGDDVTDEDAFAVLRGPDVGVKVGPGPTSAGLRIDDPLVVARLLAALAEERSAHVSGAGVVPIERHALLSDQRTVALVTPSARITWACAPRIDSAAIFAALLDGPGAGYFDVTPLDDAGAPIETDGEQRYDGDSLVLVTDFGSCRVTDFLDTTGGRVTHRAGRTDLVRHIEGRGRVRVTFAPRLDYSRTPTALVGRAYGVEVLDSPDPIVLHATCAEWEVLDDGIHQTAVAEIDLDAHPGGVGLLLRFGSAATRPIASCDERAVVARSGTARMWQRWADDLRIPEGIADGDRPMVMRSALTLKALVYGPTGAIAAAATTSLPETIGGVRNWDYRFCWPRDAAIAATALVKLGSIGEAMHLLDWTMSVLDHTATPDRLQPLYGVTGERIVTEGEIGELSGYAGSRPVRVGNAAARQVQLDVFGPIAELLHELAIRDAPLTPEHWRIVEAMVGAVSARWEEPDHGIWELRARPRHHVHSRVMCWLTVDRGIRIAELLHGSTPEIWTQLRDAIAADVLEHGWDDRSEAFASAYGSDELDAASLWVGLGGLVDAGDPRFARTIEAIERELLEDGGVYRYLFEDGLPGREGTFHLCTCWLVQSLALVGRRADARALFDTLLGRASPLGLFSEEYDVRDGIALGNHPQAYSHAGVIECALALRDR